MEAEISRSGTAGAPQRFYSGAQPLPLPIDETGRLSGRTNSRTEFMTEQTKPIALYYWPTPNGWKISIMLEELGVPYEIKIRQYPARASSSSRPFWRFRRTIACPRSSIRKGPAGEPISVFESGAILQYLGRKFGKFYPADERKRVEVDEWLFWQVGGLGPMAGQAHHFRQYAPEKIDYAYDRYTNEVNRLYGVMNKRLADREFLAGDYSIADMACIGWVKPYKNQGQDLDDFPNLKRWFETMLARPAVDAGLQVGEEHRRNIANDQQAKKVLFGQRTG